MAHANFRARSALHEWTVGADAAWRTGLTGIALSIAVAAAFVAVGQRVAVGQSVGAAPSIAASQPASQPASGPSALRERYTSAAASIAAAARSGTDAYRKLEILCDDVGHRLSGSPALEKALEWAAEQLRRDGLENVRREPVQVPRWVRGAESLEMFAPQRMTLPMLGLGGSVGTPEEGVSGEVLPVSSLDELNELGDKAAGRIVLFNVPMSSAGEQRGTGYGPAVQYRALGARWAAEHGAVAALVRSPTTRSLRSPHTGGMHYAEAPRRIPAAAISVEDAERIARLHARGIPVRVTLKMEARNEGLAPSANVIGELRGTEKPDEIVVIGGHIDSWDVGQGAHDDGGGVVTAMEAANLLRKLNLRPRRTIRVVLFTNEENGLAGGRDYAERHADELPKHAAAIEVDSGVFGFTGYSLEHRDAARQSAALAALGPVMPLFAPFGGTELRGGGSGADIGPLRPGGVLLLGQNADMTHYFDVHHTHADTLDKVDRRELDKHVGALALMAYILADMPGPAGER